MLHNKTLLSVAVLLSLHVSAVAADWYVHADPAVGNDEAAGRENSPLATLQRAVTLAESGDTIHLIPEGTLFRQTVLLNAGDDGLTIEGNSCILTGADVVDREGWEDLGDGLWRKLLPVPRWDRHLLVVDGKVQTMARTPSTPAETPFPAAADLLEGEFRYDSVEGDEDNGWLTVRADPARVDLEWGNRANGLATSGSFRGLIVRNLKARHCLNDGFNIHGDARELIFEGIEGFDCYDEGFSAHDTCEAVIRDGRFTGGDHAVADVNAAETHYDRCFFAAAINCNVLFQGGVHSLTDCVIEVAGTETALSLTTPGAGKDGVEPAAARLRIERLEIRAADTRTATEGGKVSLGGNTQTTLIGSGEITAPGGLYMSPTAQLNIGATE